MNSGSIAARYATALFDFAKESNELERVYEEAKALQNVFSKLPTFRLALENPVSAKSEKRSIILSAVGGKSSKSFELFLNLLLKNNRETVLQFVMLKYINLYRSEKNIHYGKLITAEILDVETENKLVSSMQLKTGGTIELEKVIDPSLLGGFIFEIDFQRLDASIKGQLDSIRKGYFERNIKTI